MRVGDRHCIKRLWEGVSANEIDETSTEEALHQADPDEAQAAARHHRRCAIRWRYCCRITLNGRERTSETDPEEEALHEADPDEAQAAARRHRRLCFAFNARITTDEEGRTSETDPEEEALYEADPDEAQGSPGHHSAKAVPEVV
jgi:hypothetical protein